MTTPARALAETRLLSYDQRLHEFQRAWADEVDAWLAWTDLARELGPAHPEVVELRKAWEATVSSRREQANALDVAADELGSAVRAVEREVVHA